MMDDLLLKLPTTNKFSNDSNNSTLTDSMLKEMTDSAGALPRQPTSTVPGNSGFSIGIPVNISALRKHSGSLSAAHVQVVSRQSTDTSLLTDLSSECGRSGQFAADAQNVRGKLVALFDLHEDADFSASLTAALSTDTTTNTTTTAATAAAENDECDEYSIEHSLLTQPVLSEHSKYQLLHLLALHDLQTMQPAKDCLMQLIAESGGGGGGGRGRGRGEGGEVEGRDEEESSASSSSRLQRQLLWVDLLTLVLTKSLSKPVMTEVDLEMVSRAVGPVPASMLLVPYFKLLAATTAATAQPGYEAQSRIAITYRCMRIVSSLMKNRACTDMISEWAMLEALNVIKDTCPHGNIFQQSSLDMLHGIKVSANSSVCMQCPVGSLSLSMRV